MFTLFSSCTNFVKTIVPPEPVLPYNEMFADAQPLSRTEHEHKPYKRYVSKCTLGCTKSYKNQSARDYKN